MFFAELIVYKKCFCYSAFSHTQVMEIILSYKV